MSQAERVARSPKPVAAVPKPVARSLKPVAWLGGNIGGSLLPQVDDIQPQDLVVLELSSFQLEDLAALRRSPHVAVVISFTPNHLDRHGTLEAYRQAKLNILRFQGPDDLAVLNMDDAEVARWGEYTKARVLGFGLGEVGQGAVGSGQEQGSGVGGQGSGRSGQPTAGSRQWTLDNGQRASLSALRPRPSALDPPPSTPRSLLDALQLPGRHNRLNALAALTVVTALADIGFDDLRRALAEFRGLPHRLELVAEIAGRKFYNDSIATTPESTLVALASFDAPIILIAGGYDKGLDLTPVAREAARRAKAVAFIGQTAETLHTAMLPLVAAHHLSLITRHSISTQDSALSTLAIYRAPNLPDAVHWAWQQSQPGDVILLSPACASYDQFLNFEHRGEVFRQLVADLNRP